MFFICSLLTNGEQMDWNRAIETNREALASIVAGLLAVLSGFEGVLQLPLSVYRYVGLNLRKAESAVRRLIVIAARGLVVPAPPTRPMPKGLMIERKNQLHVLRRAFSLFDTRITYSFDETEAAVISGPRIHTMGALSPREQFLSQFKRAPETLSSEVETHGLRLRLAAAARALANLTSEAKRLARWRARRKTINATVTPPMRPGPPPGINRKSQAEIDLVLRECHGLAWDSLKFNST